MNLADITTKCYILALIIRDDGERLLLGDGAYEFKDSQQHFIANTYANDVVELQGTDGQMLAGQVRRTATQTFAGYIGDATFSKQKVEEARRDFLMFFRKKHYYTAVYVFSDGTAIQRDRGYIVNAPSVPELYQRFPEWSVGLNFEDPNYYEYAEDDLGQEIAAHKVELELSTAMSGGLIWDGDGAVSDDLSYVGTEIEGEGKNFQLADTGTATLKSAELLGDASQTTYSGKNLLRWSQSGTTYTSNGITYTLQSDGTVKVNGTASANSTCYFGFNTLGEGRYVLSGCPNGGSASTYYLEANYKQTSSSSSSYPKSTSTTANAVINLEATGSVAGIYISVKSGTTVSNIIFKPMLEQTSGTATAYEPYVGGTASPNPDFPQAVNTVTGEQTVKIEGKNLFDTNRTLGTPSNTAYANTTPRTFDFTQYVKGISSNNYYAPNNITSFDVSNENITLKTTQSAYGLGFAVPTLPSTTYRISYNVTPAGGVASIGYYQKTGEWISNYSPSNGVFITPANCAFIIVSFRGSGDNVETTYSNIQLELGSTATAYEPYQGQSYEVNLGKNLFHFTETRTPYLGPIAVPLTADESSFILNGTNSSSAVSTELIRAAAPLHIRAGTYTLKVDGLNTTSSYTDRVYIAKASAPGIPIAIAGPDVGFKTTFTLSADSDIISTIIAGASSSYSNKTITLQLEAGTQATSYAAYTTPIELAKIGDYQDRIYKEDSKWYIEKQVGKVDLGTLTWVREEEFASGQFRATMVYLPEQALLNGGLLCPIFIWQQGEVTYASLQDGHMSVTNSQAMPLLRVRNSASYSSMSASDFKTAMNGIVLYYALATPTTTEITNAELIRQLERLRHAHTYADTTNFSITATSPNLPAFLKVVAFGKDAIPQGGYVWEDGGAGGATTITVDGVDNAQPIWTVVGPATNPSLTNITTGESIQWTGVVPNGQTLVVNMADMTASLSGANVFEFISGSWITLQAGNNRVSYSATAATGIATLEWNGVVG